MGTFRTTETSEKYKKLVAEGFLNNGCNLCKALSLKEFKYWRIVENNFPYDYIAIVSHMILLKRHASETEVTAKEKEELESLKMEYINQEYEYIIESTNKRKSIPGHAHLHLVIAIDR